MPFLKEKGAVADAWKKRNGGKSAAGMAAAAVAVGGAALATEAGARTIVEDVASYVINDDSSITVTFIDGTIATFEAGRYIITTGQIMLLDHGLLGGGAGLLALLALSGGNTVAAEESATTVTPDPVIVHQAQDEGPHFDLTDDDIADGVTEVEFGGKRVSWVELPGNDDLSVIDVDLVHNGTGDGPGDDDTLDITGLDGGDRVEIANDGDIEKIDLELLDTADVGSPLVVSLEGVRVNDELQIDNAEAVEVEATGAGPTILDEIALKNDTIELTLTGDQHLTIYKVSGDDALTKIDASQASGGVTIGDLEDPDAIDALTDFIGSSADDLLAVKNLGEDVSINLGAGDDTLLVEDFEFSGANVISAGPGADTIDLSDSRVAGSGNTLSIDLGANDGDADHLILGDRNANLDSNSADDNFVTVQNFEVGTDLLDLMAVTVTDPGVGALTTGGKLTNGLNIIQSFDVSDLTDPAAVSSELRSEGYEFVNSDDEVYAIVSDGTSSALYHFEDDGGANIANDGDEASLVAVFEGIADMSGLTADHVDFIA